MEPFLPLSSVSTTFPIPLPAELTRDDFPGLYRQALMFSYPGARVFWSIVVFSIVALLVLHAITIRDILKARRAPGREVAKLAPLTDELLAVPADADTETLMKGRSEW